MNDATVRQYDVNLIDSNPFRSRELDEAYALELAAEIKEKGFHGTLAGRPSPHDPNRVEIEAGEHRLWALQHLAKTDPQFRTVMVQVREMTDAEMEQGTIIENAWRKNPSPIEVGKAMFEYKKRHANETNEQIAKLFHYADGTAVTNHLKYLNLPTDLQGKLDKGEISEVLARRFVPIQRIADQGELKEIIQSVLAEEPSEREQKLLGLVDEVLEDKACDLGGVPWELSGWPKTPVLSGTVADAAKGEPTDLLIPACKGCESYFKSDFDENCLKPACYRLKARLWARTEAERLSKTMGITVQAAQGEHVTRLLSKTQDDREWIARVLKSKKAQPLLRLMPQLQHLDEKTREIELDYTVSYVTGSKVVALGTTDYAEIERLIKRTDDDEEDTPRASSSAPKAVESASAQEKKTRDKAAKETRAHTRDRNEGARLVAAAAKAMASALPSGKVLELLGRQMQTDDTVDYLDVEYTPHYGDGGSAFKRLPETEQRQLVMVWLIGDDIVGSTYRPIPLEKTRASLEEIARGLKVKLPKTWDSVAETPRLQQMDRCWHCGAEHGTNGYEVSQADIERGWQVIGDAKKPDDIICPECAQDIEANLSEDEFAKSIGMKPVKGKTEAKTVPAKRGRKAKKK